MGWLPALLGGYVGALRRGGDQRCRLGADGVDERGDGACCLVQGGVGVVGVHGGVRRGVLVDGGEPSVVAVPSHCQGELGVVPLHVRGDHVGGAAAGAGWCCGEPLWLMPVPLRCDGW